MSVDGLWHPKSAGQVSHATDRRGYFTDNERQPTATPALPAARAHQKRSRGWRKRALWLGIGTVVWLLACVGVRQVFGDGATLLEAVLLVLILGTVIGLTID